MLHTGRMASSGCPWVPLTLLLGLASCALTGAQQGGGGSGGCNASAAGFLHGVASGDPLPTRVVLWTRFTPPTASVSSGGVSSSSASLGPYQVQYYVSTRANATQAGGDVIASGNLSASAQTDYTVKVDASGLQPDTRYYYWFRHGNYSSLLGVTRTAPALTSSRAGVRFLFTSCANWRFGYFNVYNMTAKIKDIDFMVFLGDYVYEHGNDSYPAPSEAARDSLVPGTELRTLADFRARHALFKTDLALQNMHRRVPAIAIWDDHDVKNNAWKGGAPDFNGSQANQTWTERVDAGTRAWHEWMPIRDNLTASASGAPNDLLDIYRTFTFGRIMTLVVGEQRFAYRTQQYDFRSDPYIMALDNNPPDQWDSLPDLAQKRANYLDALTAPNRTIYGPQVQRILRDFSNSTANNVTWQVLGNTVIMGPRRTPDIETAINEKFGIAAQAVLNGILSTATSQLLSVVEAISAPARILVGTGRYHDPVVVDGWDGYQYERSQLFNIFSNSTNNAIVLAGDSHNAWAYNLKNGSNVTVATEFDSPSVTPPGFDQLTSILPTDVDASVIVRGMFLSNNDTLDFADITHRGAIIVNATQDVWHADYWFMDDVSTPEADARCAKAYEVRAGSPGLRNATCSSDSDTFFELGSSQDPLPVQAAGYSSAVAGTQLTNCSGGAAAAGAPATNGAMGIAGAPRGLLAAAVGCCLLMMLP